MDGVTWGMIGEPVSVETVIAKLLEHHEVTREQCEMEVPSFLDEMNREGLIVCKGNANKV